MTHDFKDEGLLEEADPRQQTFIKQRYADYSGRAKTRIIARQQDKLRKEAIADLQRGTEGLFEDSVTAAFEGDVTMIEVRRQELNELLAEGVEGELIDDGAAIALSEDFERQVTAQEVMGNFGRLVQEQGPDAGAKAIAVHGCEGVKPSGITGDAGAEVIAATVCASGCAMSVSGACSA